MTSYARIGNGKDINVIQRLFLDCGADLDDIILDNSHDRKKENNAYRTAKDRAAETGSLLIDSLDSLGKTCREISRELKWLAEQQVCLHVVDLPSTLEDGFYSTNLLNDVYAQLADTEREKVRKAQTAGIRKAQADQKKLGRTRIPAPANWEACYEKWEKGTASISQLMEETGLKRGTLYNLLKATKEEKKSQEQCC